MLKVFLQSVASQAVARSKVENPEVLRSLASLFLQAYPEAMLSKYSEEELVERILLAYQVSRVRRRGEIKVEIKPRDGLTLIFINKDDQPFLLDTLKLQMEEMGVPYELYVHPIITVERDQGGELVRVAPSWEEGPKESLILFEARLEPTREEEVRNRLLTILRVAGDVVGDFVKMKRRLRDAINDLDFYREIKGDPQGELEETGAFLEWLYDRHFVFLGFLYLEDRGEEGGLGICRPQHKGVPGLFSIDSLKERLDRGDRAFRYTKGRETAQLYRRCKLDVVAVRSFSEDGEPKGWHLFFGLFTKRALTEKTESIPILRLKLQRILQSMRVVVGSYDYKRVVMLYDLFPLEELLISPEREIEELISSVLYMGREDAVKVFQRLREEYLALMVVFTQEKYSARLEEEIEGRLEQLVPGAYIETRLFIYEDSLVFLWFFLYRDELALLDGKTLEEEISELSLSWEDRFKDFLSSSYPPEEAGLLYHRYGGLFPEEYKAITPPEEAVVDLLYLEQLRETGEIQVSFHQEEEYTRIKFFSLEDLTLSSTVPVLENMDLEVLDEVSIHLEKGRETYCIHSFRVVTSRGGPVFEEVWYDLSEALRAVMAGEMESDSLNKLVVREGLDWKVVDLFRTYRNYLRQVAPRFSPASVSKALLLYPRVARVIWNFFDAKFDPAKGGGPQQREETLSMLRDRFEKVMAKVEHINEDSVLRALFNLVESTVRTNFYRKDRVSHYISVKMESARVKEMPLPRPMFEIYVHDKGMEGIHLRGGKVARGGIRWSDRVDDFRREILDLMKTQMVKNALIIPVGAKGGFVVKEAPRDRKEEARLAKEKYKILIRGMLDVTDNVVDGEVVPPPLVVCYDQNDPYLVVAADKGTAHLSDVANELAREYGFWLDDAFASGGSTGYSHKELGITAKGAWVCVRRHFMEMGVDPERDVITVVGIGDMGGDVFGNGMLLSKTIELVGAFNHIQIFLDPNPHPETSWQERKRLFDEVRGWDGYNPQLISEGGGVYPRDAKAIPLSPQVREVLGTDKDEVSGQELIQLLLKAPVDLLWNGGIGTYVKSSLETHQEVGDPANDPVRVDAKDLRVKVVGEGGNLGFTQKARVEYALKGGRINTDALDNSGGVDLSDHEVNIKILLQGPVKRGRITLGDRNRLLEEVAHQVVDAVLYDNYRQSLAVSLDIIRSKRNLEPFQWVMEKLVDINFLDRRDVYLPSPQELDSRKKTGRGLLRPELSLLLGYEKLWVKEQLRGCAFIKATYLNEYLERYFPPHLRELFQKEIVHHLLRDEIVLTIITNTIVNQAGVSFFARMMSELEANPGEVAASYMMMEGVLKAPMYRQEVYALDFSIPAHVQYEALLDMEEAIEILVRWSLFFSGDWLPIKEVIEKYRSRMDSLIEMLPRVLPPGMAMELERGLAGYREQGFPEDLANTRASLPYLADSMSLFTLAEYMGKEMEELAPIYYHIVHLFKLDGIFRAIREERKRDHWEVLAYTYLERDIWHVKRELTKKALGVWEEGMGPQDLEARLAAKEPWIVDRLGELRGWIEERGARGLAAWTVALRRLREVLV